MTIIPPASYDLRVVECEGGHEFPEKWDSVRNLEDHLGLTDVDEIESEEESEGEQEKDADQNDDELLEISDSD